MPTPAPAPTQPSRARRALGVLLRVSLGITVGLGIAELAFTLRDHRAFPHLNVYRADDHLGVRLLPGASTRIAYGGNPPSSIRINAAGLRGAELGPPRDQEIVVVGDSQVFGLGVEEQESLPAQLEKRLRKPVINAGVPTYGPLEYVAVMKEIFAARRPEVVVYVVNLANDLFEADRPNRERHAVWDGWAVRKETAPIAVASFPGRDLVYRRSHLAYAARQAWYGSRARRDDHGFASEGTWRDLAGRAGSIADAEARAAVEAARLSAIRDVEVAYAEQAARHARYRVDAIVQGETYLRGYDQIAYEAASHDPGDLLAMGCGEECTRPVAVTADLIRAGAAIRARLEENLRRRAAVAPSPARQKEVEKLDDWKKQLAEREQRLAALRDARALVARAASPMAPTLRAAKAITDAHGARLVVVALPLDVMVDPAEWKKYGSAPVDLGPAQILVDDVVEAAVALGADGIDVGPALRAAQPGAFLLRDIHLSPRGQAAVAEAIAARLAEKPLPAAPRGGLEPRRTRVPAERDYADVGEVVVKRSSAANCETKMIREWFRVVCRKRKERGAPTAVKLVRGGRGESVALAAEGVTTLLAPLLLGDELVADFSWEDRSRRLTIHFRADSAELDMRFEPTGDPFPAPPSPAGFDRVCACYKEVHKAATCGGFPAFVEPRCLATYPNDCAGLVACAGGDAFQAPRCERGSANAGATAHCFALCGPDLPCKQGTCTAWDGGNVCM